jgi:hypothetical protein
VAGVFVPQLTPERTGRHDRVISLAEELLGTSEIAPYMGIVTAKYSGQSSGYN